MGLKRALKRAKVKWALRVYYRIGSKLPSSQNRFGKYYKHFRAILAKQFIRHCGENVNIEPHSYFSVELSIGDNSGIGQNSILYGKVTIGNNVMMGEQCIIYTRNHSTSRTDIPMMLQGFDKSKPVIIGDDVWIGGRVTILPGVNVGDGSILAAGAVVVKDVPPYTMVAGNPAIVKKHRKNEEKQLLH